MNASFLPRESAVLPQVKRPAPHPQVAEFCSPPPCTRCRVLRGLPWVSCRHGKGDRGPKAGDDHDICFRLVPCVDSGGERAQGPAAHGRLLRGPAGGGRSCSVAPRRTRLGAGACPAAESGRNGPSALGISEDVPGRRSPGAARRTVRLPACASTSPPPPAWPGAPCSAARQNFATAQRMESRLIKTGGREAGVKHFQSFAWTNDL